MKPAPANATYAKHYGPDCPKAVKGSYIVTTKKHTTCKACLKRIANT
jgi:hypothetical protein